MKRLHLTFVEINFNKLIIGKKYFIKIKCTNYIINRFGYFNKYVEEDIGYFINMTYYKTKFHNMYVNMDDTFYEIILQKELIQQSMEKRAINKILRQLIDESFNIDY